MRESCSDQLPISHGMPLSHTLMNIAEKTVKPNSCLQQLTAINRRNNRNVGKHNSKRPKVVVLDLTKETIIMTALSNIKVSPKRGSTYGLSLAPFISTASLFPLQTQCLLAAGKIYYGVSLIKILLYLQHVVGLGRLEHGHFGLIVLNWTAYKIKDKFYM